jgi:hypothetical protein
MMGIGCISDTDEIVKVSCSVCQHGGSAAFELSEVSPLPQAVSAKDLPGGRNDILCIHQILIIDCHPGETDEESPLESI